MAFSLNEATILGNLGRDPEMRYTASGQAVTQFSVATSRSWKPEGATDWSEETTWHRVVVWGREAEHAAERLRKGSKVLVKGRLQLREWEDNKTGMKRQVTEIVAERLVYLEKSGGTGGNRQVDDYIDAQAAAGVPATRSDTPPSEPRPTVPGDEFDDLPF